MNEKLEKIAKSLGNLTMLEALELAAELKERWGIRDYVPMTLRPAEELLDVIDEGPEYFDVILRQVTGSKLEVLKIVRRLKPELTLTGAKEFIMTPHVVVASGLVEEQARALSRELAEAGAEVDMVTG